MAFEMFQEAKQQMEMVSQIGNIMKQLSQLDVKKIVAEYEPKIRSTFEMVQKLDATLARIEDSVNKLLEQQIGKPTGTDTTD